MVMMSYKALVFNQSSTIQTLIANKIIRLYSFITAAGWSDTVFLTIDRYYFTIQLYTQTLVAFSLTN